MTGKNPGEHGIFGFTDRRPGTYELYFPNYSNLKTEPFWDRLGERGKRCCVLNVPSTYPARPLNGVLVSGFVAPSLERATYPAEALAYLQSSGYRIDVDASKARESLDLFLEDLHETTERRREAFLHFLGSEDWDLFTAVFTGTDRLHHFLWNHYEEDSQPYGREFLNFYKRLDEIVGELVAELPDDTALLMLSDHGFCSLHRQVYLNHFLQEQGLLSFSSQEPKTIADIDPAGTRAYCMDPGRIYINLQGREQAGCVSPGAEYEGLLDQLHQMLLGVTDPENGEKIVERVVRGSDIYSGPMVEFGPDLIVDPKRGYDLKGAVGRAALTDSGIFAGMHTQDDAMLFTSGHFGQQDGRPSIRECAPMIESIFTT
jgi:predicted AlkP superfamily phosphohydrolase/phosphomutase